MIHKRFASITKQPYAGKMVNFKTKNSTHIAYPDELKMGDNAWQQYLARADAKVSHLADITSAIDQAKPIIK